MIKFRKKEFSDNIKSGAVKGAVLGASIGSIIGGTAPAKLPKFIPFSEKYNNLSKNTTNKDGKTKATTTPIQKLSILGVSTLVGAALGALVGVGKNINDYVSRKPIDNRLINQLVRGLSNNYKEGVDFTRDPKEANRLKTKVCLVFSKNAGEFKILVNLVDDPKLNRISDKILKTLPKDSQVKKESVANRYNEINISTISDSPNNLKTIYNMVNYFIQSGYPVYIIEVG